MRRQRLFVVPATIYGPESGVTQPAGSYAFTPGDTSATIQSAVTAQSAGTTFWFPAGTYPITGRITPKTGNAFVGQYGAVIDGSGWAREDPPELSEAVFFGEDNGINNVTIRNLVIRNGPEYGINSYLTTGWTVNHCEIHGCRNGVSTGSNGVVTNNHIHHCTGPASPPTTAERGGGYGFHAAHAIQFINNQVSYCGAEHKFIHGLAGPLNEDHIVRDNWFHHNQQDGLWFDGDGAGSILEYNICEDNGRSGISIENGSDVTIRNNICRRHLTGEAVLFSATRDSVITNNYFEGNLFGIGLYLNVTSNVGTDWGPWVTDLSGNSITGNEIHVPSVPASSYGSYLVLQDVVDPSPYFTNTKNNHWQSNTYFAPNTTSAWFAWNGNKSFTNWQGVPQDTLGSITAE